VPGALTARVKEAPLDLDRWLNAPDRAPVALALSGGGDSLALLHLAKAWADQAGRPLVALTVDHGLQGASADWARFAAGRAARLGVLHRTLVWRGEKPAAGLLAAARAARHGLLADGARAAGARVILMGHTADDLAEAETMRRAGAAIASPRVWSPSPAWPQGRGVFLLRPLLGHRRADLRRLLTDLGEAWIEDPANDDPRHARTLARRRLAIADNAPPAPVERRRPPAGLEFVREGVAGELAVPRAALSGPDGRQLLAAMALCAAGTSRPPSAAALGRIADRMAAGADVVATLAGARIEATDDQMLVCREAGEFRRAGVGEAALPIGENVFDGRFLITARDGRSRIAPLRGLAARLPPAQRARLAAIPPAARGALPALISPIGEVSCPLFTESAPASAKSLVLTRLCATLGRIRDEASLWRVAKPPPAP
jgi:tRNA(Ile)-lysidine synthase